MATVYGNNADKLLVDVPAQQLDAGDAGGRVRSIYDKYTLTADLASADVIKMGAKIPAGARVIECILKCADLDASGGTLDVGWEASADAVESANTSGFYSNVDVATAADVFLASQNAASPAGIMKKFSSAVQPIITVDGDTDATTGDIELVILYIVD